MSRKFPTNSRRKGVSPLVAAVLLIAFTMALAAILTVSITRIATQTTAEAEQRAECTNVAFEIDRSFVQYDALNGLLRARIRNLGTNPLQINEYSVTFAEDPNVPVFWSVTDPASNTRIPAQQSIIATFNATNETGGGTLTRIKFESNCPGLTDEVSVERFGGVWPTTALDPTRVVPATLTPA